MTDREQPRKGSFRWGLAALLLGLPLPFVIIAFLFGDHDSVVGGFDNQLQQLGIDHVTTS